MLCFLAILEMIYMFDCIWCAVIVVFNSFVYSNNNSESMASKLSSLEKGTRALRLEFFYPNTISWYPGHMDKTMKQLKEKFLPYTNIIMEIRDARIPISSEHPHFNKLLQGKPKLVIFNKADLLGHK